MTGREHRASWLAVLMLTAGLCFGGAATAAPAGKIEADLLAELQRSGQSEFLIWFGETDLSAAQAEKGRTAKSRRVMETLRAAARERQAGVIAELQQRGLAYRSFWIANAVIATGSLADVQALALRPEVLTLYRIRSRLPELLPPTIARHRELPQRTAPKAPVPGAAVVAKALGDNPEPGVRLINAPQVWAMGFKGQGVVVGDHDVGVRWDHPALKNQYRGWNGSSASHAYNWRNAFGAADPFCTDPEVPCDSNGHGTHTTGTMVGYDGGDNQIGVAPEAKWMACRSLLDPVLGVGTVPTYMDCMEWQLAPYPEGDPDAADPAMGPDVISNSWGCVEACVPPVLKAAGDAIYAAGQVQVVSAGNDGQGTIGGEGGEASCSTLAFPTAVYESSFTVGANDVMDEMASFSSLGPVLSDGSMRLKPNVSAPGVATRSSWNDGDYDTISGTSMAGPHVAGMIALIMSAEPRLIGRPADVRLLVERTANPAVGTTETASTCGGTPATTIPNNIFGHGRIDALAAVLARPKLEIGVTAPAGVAVGEVFSVVVNARQPATGKIDVTNIGYTLGFSAPVTVIDSVGCGTGLATGVQSAVVDVIPATLEPGQSTDCELILRGDAAGTLAMTITGEADQVSPVDGTPASTRIGSGGSAADAGRFGGTPAPLLLAGLMLAALARLSLRRRPRA